MLFRNECKRAILKNNREAKEMFDTLQKDLRDNWLELKDSRRVEIHYNNLHGEELKKLTMAKFQQKQNLQIGRIFRVLDPNVDIIYISAIELPSEVTKYYMKVLEMNGIPNISQRIHFLMPDNADKFPEHFSLPSLVYYSPNTMKQGGSLKKDN